LPEFETFCLDVEEISSGSNTTHSDISLPEYEVLCDDHVKEISSVSPTTHSDSSLYASFIFDLSINPFPPADRSNFYEFTDELIPFISPPEYDCFLFKVEPNSRDFTKDVVKEKQEKDKIGSKPDKKTGSDDDEESESDEESDSDETREEESFDPIPRTPEDSEDDGNGEEDQGLRITEEERLNEEEEAEELYRDVNINQGRGIQETLDVEDSHVTLTLVHPNGQQESSSVSSQFVTSMLNPPSDADVMMMMIRKKKDPPLDQTEGLRDGENVSASESAFAEEPVQTISQMDEPSYPVFETGTDDQTIVQSSQHPEWFSQPKKPPTLDRD
nr:hypothetical protein [Tanacetum cinerariifolium]